LLVHKRVTDEAEACKNRFSNSNQSVILFI
jgi:hypothetical protein